MDIAASRESAAMKDEKTPHTMKAPAGPSAAALRSVANMAGRRFHSWTDSRAWIGFARSWRVG